MLLVILDCATCWLLCSGFLFSIDKEGSGRHIKAAGRETPAAMLVGGAAMVLGGRGAAVVDSGSGNALLACLLAWQCFLDCLVAWLAGLAVWGFPPGDPTAVPFGDSEASARNFSRRASQWRGWCNDFETGCWWQVNCVHKCCSHVLNRYM
eukprot:Skav202230  [mRNA]  locus=scaffold2988:73202:73654:+ [translate_table: standard]